MNDSALQLFESLKNHSRLKELVDSGEAEGLYLECKAPREPRLSRELKPQLATALSGFANTEGGVVIWGVGTTRHSHENLDVLTQIEPVGNCRKFAKQVETVIPRLTTPPITNCKNKVIVESTKDTRGVVLTYIPRTTGDPVQSSIDQKFYFRNGDEFSVLPYQMIQRLFAATSSPDLYPLIDGLQVSIDEKGLWKIPIVITNNSSAVGEKTDVLVSIENPSSCENTSFEGFRDVSDLNPGQKMFSDSIHDAIHRGLDIRAGNLHVGMRKDERVLRLKIRIYANKMRAREWQMAVQLTESGFSVKKTMERFLY